MKPSLKVNQCLQNSPSIFFIASTLLIVIVLLALYCFPYPFIPDFFGLSTNENLSTYLSTILSSVSSLSGLLIAILLIAFEYYKNNLNKIYLRYFTKNRSLILLILLYLFVFLFSGLSFFLLKKDAPIGSGELSLCYISVISFLFLVPMTFYLSYSLVKSLNVNNIIEEYLDNLDFDRIFLININKDIFPSQSDEDRNTPITKVVDEDTLRILYQLIMNRLEADDFIQAQVVLTSIAEKFNVFFLNKIKEDVQLDTASYQFRYANFLVSLVSETKEKRLHYKVVLRKSIDVVENLYEYYNDKKYNVTYLEPLRESFYSDLFQIFHESDFHREEILKSIKNIIDSLIKLNLPPDMDYSSFSSKLNEGDEETIKKNYEYRRAWDIFCSKYPAYFSAQIERALSDKNEKYFFIVLSLYKRCTFYWKWRNKDSNKHLRSDWITRNFTTIVSLYKSAIERDLIHKVQAYDLLSDVNLSNLFKDEEICARAVLVNYLRFVIWLNEKDLFYSDIFYGVFSLGDFGNSYYSPNSLASLGAFFAREYHKGEHYQNGLEDVLSTFMIIYNKDTIAEGKAKQLITKEKAISLLHEIKQSYLLGRKKHTKSQKLLRNLNRLKRGFETKPNNTD